MNNFTRRKYTISLSKKSDTSSPAKPKSAPISTISSNPLVKTAGFRIKHKPPRIRISKHDPSQAAISSLIQDCSSISALPVLNWSSSEPSKPHQFNPDSSSTPRNASIGEGKASNSIKICSPKSRLKEGLSFEELQKNISSGSLKSRISSEINQSHQKFNSPAICRYEPESNPSYIPTEISAQPHTKGPSLPKQTTLEELEAMHASVPKYSEMKTHLIIEDPLTHGIHGTLKKWKIGDSLGHGSMGQVLKALNIETGEIFAIKRIFFNPSISTHQEYVNILKQEIDILKQLEHPHIVKYLGSETIHENFCVYLEFAPGGSLARLLGTLGPLPESTVRVYLRQVLEGLNYLHSKGVIHRDVKAANILLDGEGNVKLSDFGCSKQYENDETQSGFLNSFKGSILWMAPEVLKKAGYGRKADIWSVGILALELLTGRPPWPEFDNYISAVMKIACSSDIPSIPDSLSSDAKDFIQKCLERNPTLRSCAKELLGHPFITGSIQANSDTAC